MIAATCLVFLLLFQEEATLNDFSAADQFSEAVGKFNSVQRSESEPMFEGIVTALEELDHLDEDQHLIMTESLKFLGVLKYPEETEAYFEKLIRFDPSYALRTRNLPPKIVGVFDALKQKLVGQVRVSVYDIANANPLDEAVFVIDGRPMGTVYGEKTFFVFTGEHQLEVRCPNYDSYSEQVQVIPEVETEMVASLTRIASQYYVVSYPGGCNVMLNDQLLGTTSAEVPQYYRDRLSKQGIALSDAGAMVINDLGAGTYKLRLEKACFRSRLFEFEVTEPKRDFFEPVGMERAQAFLNVTTATERSGVVYFNTERVGLLPVTNHEICPGNYELRVAFTDGEYIKNVSLKDGETSHFTAEPLPSIVWFGLEDEREGRPPNDIGAWISAMKSWNVRTEDSNNTTLVPINPFPILFKEQEMASDLGEALTRQLRADLYMAARVVRHKVVIRNVEVAFWTPLSKRIHVRSFDFREFFKFRELLERLDAVPTLTKPWLGVQVAGLRGVKGVKILEVHQGGPLSGQVQPGEFITAINGNPLREPDELVGLSSLDPVTLEVSGREVKVTPVATIREVYLDVEAAPQGMLARFEKLGKYHPDPLIRQAALFNQARFQMLLGDYAHAFDIFSSLKLGDSYGINQGSLYFYQGLCFRRLKLSSDANTSFKVVLDYPNATLFDAYGPKAAFWAEAEMNNPDK